MQWELRENIVQFKKAVEAVGWGPGRKNCTVSGGKGDWATERLEGQIYVVSEGSELRLREGHWRKHLHSFGDQGRLGSLYRAVPTGK